MSDLLRRDGDFEPLRFIGPNGLLSIIGGLFFWRRAAQDSTASIKSDWMETMNDVAYVISQLL